MEVSRVCLSLEELSPLLRERRDAVRSQQPHKDRHLRPHTFLRFVEHDALRAVRDVLLDFVPVGRREAVETPSLDGLDLELALELGEDVAILVRRLGKLSDRVVAAASEEVSVPHWLALSDESAGIGDAQSDEQSESSSGRNGEGLHGGAMVRVGPHMRSRDERSGVGPVLGDVLDFEGWELVHDA